MKSAAFRPGQLVRFQNGRPIWDVPADASLDSNVITRTTSDCLYLVIDEHSYECKVLTPDGKTGWVKKSQIIYGSFNDLEVLQ